MNETSAQAAITAQRLTDAIATVGSAISTEKNETRAAEFMRSRAMLDYLVARLASANLDLAIPGTITNIDASTNSAMGEWNSYAANGNAGHLTNASSHLLNAYRYALELPLPPQALGDAAPAQFLESLRASAEQSLVAVSGSRDAASNDLEQLRGKVGALTTLVDQQTRRLDEALAEQQRLFQKGQDERVAGNQVAMTELGQKVDALDTELAEQAQASIAAMARMRDQAQELLHIIGNTGMAGEYAKTANSNRRTALIWQVIAFGSLAGLVGFAIHAYGALTGTEVEVSRLLGRVFVAATFGVVAAYASRQADHAQRGEERNRRYALVLSSIDPYLADIPEDQRAGVKIELAKTLFHQPGSETAIVAEAAFDGNAKDFMELLIQLASAFKAK